MCIYAHCSAISCKWASCVLCEESSVRMPSHNGSRLYALRNIAAVATTSKQLTGRDANGCRAAMQITQRGWSRVKG